MLKSWFNQNLEGGYRKSLFAIFTSFLPKSTWKMFAKKCSKDTFENPPTFWRILQKWKIFHNSFRNISRLSRNIFLTSWDHMVAQKSHWKGLNLYFHSVWRFGRHYSDIVPTLNYRECCKKIALSEVEKWDSKRYTKRVFHCTKIRFLQKFFDLRIR